MNREPCHPGMCYTNEPWAMCDEIRVLDVAGNLTTMEDAITIADPSQMVCNCYACPYSWQKMGGCPRNTIKKSDEGAKKKFVNPLKASKRKNR